MKLHYPHDDSQAKVTIIATSESLMPTKLQVSDPESRDRSLYWLQHNPKALTSLMRNSAVQDAILQAAAKDPDLLNALHKALGNPEASSPNIENLRTLTNFEESVSEDSTIDDIDNAQMTQLNEAINIFVKTDSKQAEYVEAINAFVATNSRTSTTSNTMAISVETNHNSRVWNSGSNAVVKSNSFKETLLPRGTVATVVQRFNPVKDGNTTQIYRVVRHFCF